MAQSFVRLVSDFWLAQSELYATNSGIWLSQGQACLIDPGLLPAEIEAIAAFLTEREAVPQTIILTHSHWDHLLGPAHFPGAEVVAQADKVGIEGEVFVGDPDGELRQAVQHRLGARAVDHHRHH